MSDVLAELIAANLTLVGTHFAMSHPLRAPLVRLVGEKLFPAFYSLVSLAALVWIYFAFTAAPPADLPGTGEAGWIVASLILLPALALLAGSFSGNPVLALHGPDAEEMATSEPKGVFRVTRHPMMWAIGLWALSHLVLFWSMRTMITAAAMGFLALVGAHLQDGRKRSQLPEAWATWESKTSFWPRLGQLHKVDAKYWLIGAALWAAFSWAHIPIGGIPAGIWRWI